jgi:hypothetical protein
MHKLFYAIGSLVCVAVLVIASGCGASDNQPSLSKKAFIVQGDAICGQTEAAQLKSLARYVKGHPEARKELEQPGSSAADRGLVTTAALPPIEEAVEKLERLSMPHGDEDELQSFFDELNGAILETEEQPSTFLTDAQNGPFKRADEVAARYGFQACAHLP